MNYLDYEATFNSIRSLQSTLAPSTKLKVYVVDNKTSEDQLLLLRKKTDQLHCPFTIDYIPSIENLGFSRGLNLGVDRAKKDQCSYIICSNNDITYNEIIDFSHVIDLYTNNPAVALIGPQIINNQGIQQNPMYGLEVRPTTSFKTKLIEKIIFTNTLGKYIYYIKGYFQYVVTKDQKVKSLQSTVNHKISRTIYCLHGAFFILTPAYFKHYKELDPNTFLFSEELILSERLHHKNLKGYFTNNITVTHIGGASTRKAFDFNKLKASMFIVRQKYISRSYFLKKYFWKK